MITYLQKLKAKKGFTLVELIVVVAIIAVLTALIVPNVVGQLNNASITAANTTAKTVLDAAKVTSTNLVVEGKALKAIDGSITGKVEANGNIDIKGTAGLFATGALDSVKTSMNDILVDLKAGSSFIVIIKKGLVESAAWSEAADLSGASSIPALTNGLNAEGEIVGVAP